MVDAGQPSFQGFALSLIVPDEAEANRLFAALADGGQVRVPLTKTFFSPLRDACRPVRRGVVGVRGDLRYRLCKTVNFQFFPA